MVFNEYGGVNMNMILRIGFLLTAYAIGSIPTALIYSRLRHKADIRTLGDGNMGARNTKRQYGFYAGAFVAAVDIFKGALVILLAMGLKLPLEWQLLAGVAVILGHDFPVFAGFRGGQGFAVTSGVFLALFPIPGMIGFVIYVFLYLLLHNSDLAAGAAMAQIALHTALTGARPLAVIFIVSTLLFIPFKKWLDRSRREVISGTSEQTARPEGKKLDTK